MSKFWRFLGVFKTKTAKAAVLAFISAAYGYWLGEITFVGLAQAFWGVVIVVLARRSIQKLQNGE